MNTVNGSASFCSCLPIDVFMSQKDDISDDLDLSACRNHHSDVRYILFAMSRSGVLLTDAHVSECRISMRQHVFLVSADSDGNSLHADDERVRAALLSEIDRMTSRQDGRCFLLLPSPKARRFNPLAPALRYSALSRCSHGAAMIHLDQISAMASSISMRRIGHDASVWFERLSKERTASEAFWALSDASDIDSIDSTERIAADVPGVRIENELLRAAIRADVSLLIRLSHLPISAIYSTRRRAAS